ncbi:transporter substrate-binding domain-containing protein [Pseudomonas lactis]|uniref:Transporter substrate-binding domain-containing protein n=1 Tax=Pseudomonas lactis TaxID=1615674 RepID=A0A7Y1M743_9PSED|nr:transporter substrate-binding domain-containing protein [Pseudomonas lactis]NNA76446.1 transporter substrate-binding domain-containing protein [Pseudomonas lactis]
MSMMNSHYVVSLAKKLIVSSALMGSLGVSLGVSANSEPLSALLPSDIRNSKVINVVTDAKWPPFTFVGEDGRTLEGFEVDILKAIGDKLGVDIKETSIEFAGMIPGVQANRYDIAMMAVSETPERRKTLSFVDYAYLTMGAFTLVDNKDTDVELSSLCDKTVGLQSGTNFVDFIEQDFSKYCKSLGKEVPKKLEFASADAGRLQKLSATRLLI